MRIVFMGTPDFAIPTLEAIYKSEDSVVGVFTQPDKPKGRGYTLTPPPVKVFATEHGIPVYQPTTLRSDESLELIKSLSPDLIVVVAYGKILPPAILELPPHGCINVHGSLLPKYRGAAPMQRAIIDGEKVTGVTTMYMAEGLDTGDMLLKAEFPIAPDANFETVHDGLASLGAELLIKTVEAIKAGTAVRIPQDHALATHTSKIEKSDCEINFALDANTIHDLVRGLSPIPLAFTHTPDGKLLKIIKTAVSDRSGEGAKAGEIIALDEAKGCFSVACGNGAVDVFAVLPEGKGRMGAADFIRGRKISKGDILG